MRWISLIILFFVCNKTTAQNIISLDKSPVINDFKIGAGLSSINEDMKFMKVFDDSEMKLFRVKRQVNVYEMKGEIELTFYRDILVEITVFFQRSKPSDFNHLRQSLTELHGIPMEIKSKFTDTYLFDKIYSWSISSMGLRLCYNIKHKLTEIIFWDRQDSILKKQMEPDSSSNSISLDTLGNKSPKVDSAKILFLPRQYGNAGYVKGSAIEQKKEYEVIRQGNHPNEFSLGHYVIVGTFKVKQNALSFSQVLLKEGYKAEYRFLTAKEFYYVFVFKSENNLEAAQAERDRLRNVNKYEFSDSWILTVEK